jgi:hypothetical protein
MPEGHEVVKIRSIEVRMEVELADGSTVERVVYNESPQEGFALGNVRMLYDIPWVPFFSHPADLHAVGLRQDGPSTFELKVFDHRLQGAVLLNSGEYISPKDSRLNGKTPEEFLQKPAAVRRFQDPLDHPSRFSRKT